ncbi:hypothetical protein BASA62_006857 [Batrachochytrium salamandrivorans]|nr:hypothetical protein BASA62_006857 [Batrachochytrium salamandrivorans]
MPRDVLQEATAQELYDRSWRFHKELKLWLCKDTQASAGSAISNEPFVKGTGFERGVYIFFDPLTWSRVKKEWVLYYDQLEGRIPATSKATGDTHGGVVDTGLANTGGAIGSVSSPGVVGDIRSPASKESASGSGSLGPMSYFGLGTDLTLNSSSALMHTLSSNMTGLSLGNNVGLMSNGRGGSISTANAAANNGSSLSSSSSSASLPDISGSGGGGGGSSMLNMGNMNTGMGLDSHGMTGNRNRARPGSAVVGGGGSGGGSGSNGLSDLSQYASAGNSGGGMGSSTGASLSGTGTRLAALSGHASTNVWGDC